MPARQRPHVTEVHRAEVDDSLREYGEGHRSAELTLLDVLLASGDYELARELVRSAGSDAKGEARYLELVDMLDRHREGCAKSLAIAHRWIPLAIAEGREESCVSQVKAYFDDAVAVSEEASVALYSFGDAALLEKATREVVQLVESWGLFSRQRDVLDFGCGTGRFEVLIAPLVRRIVGIDISTAMIAAARRNSAASPQVTCFATNGLDLREIPDASFDLVLAVDSMPYVVAGGPQLIDTHFAEFARVLRPSGEIVIVGYSYRKNSELDRDEVAHLASRHRFRVLEDGTSCSLAWNGLVFRLARR